MSGEVYQLDTFATGTFDANGELEVFVAPPSSEAWDIASIGVITNDSSSSTVIPEARLYLNSVADGNFIAGTYSGNLDNSDTPCHLERNQRLVCKWTGGTAGRTGTLSVNGKRVRY